MGRFHACMKICPQKATEGVCILLYCKWRGKLVTDAQKQSIHACRRDKTKNSAAAQSIVRSICPKSMPWNSPGMPESGRMKKTKNRRTARDRIWNRKVQPVFPSPFKIESLSLIHISEPTRLGMISYAVFCLKKKKQQKNKKKKKKNGRH